MPRLTDATIWDPRPSECIITLVKGNYRAPSISVKILNSEFIVEAKKCLLDNGYDNYAESKDIEKEFIFTDFGISPELDYFTLCADLYKGICTEDVYLEGTQLFIELTESVIKLDKAVRDKALTAFLIQTRQLRELTTDPNPTYQFKFPL